MEQIRQRWRRAPIEVRTDSGFARKQMLTRCQSSSIALFLGLQKNSFLCKSIKRQLQIWFQGQVRVMEWEWSVVSPES